MDMVITGLLKISKADSVPVCNIVVTPFMHSNLALSIIKHMLLLKVSRADNIPSSGWQPQGRLPDQPDSHQYLQRLLPQQGL